MTWRERRCPPAWTASACTCPRRESTRTCSRACAAAAGWPKLPNWLSGPGRQTSTAGPICRHASSRRLTRLRPGRALDGLRPAVSKLLRYLVAIAGIAQLLVATAQMVGADFGMVAVHEHGAMTGAHLLNESTAWSLAIGCGMVLTAIWPRAALGVAAVLGVYVIALTGYVIDDVGAGQVTPARIATHVPAVVGLVLVALIYFDRTRGRRPAFERASGGQDIVLPAGASRGQRRGHVRPVDHSAA